MQHCIILAVLITAFIWSIEVLTEFVQKEEEDKLGFGQASDADRQSGHYCHSLQSHQGSWLPMALFLFLLISLPLPLGRGRGRGRRGGRANNLALQTVTLVP